MVKNITISQDNLSQYPADGNIASLLKHMDINIDDDKDQMLEENLNSFIPNIIM